MLLFVIVFFDFSIDLSIIFFDVVLLCCGTYFTLARF